MGEPILTKDAGTQRTAVSKSRKINSSDRGAGNGEQQVPEEEVTDAEMEPGVHGPKEKLWAAPR